MKSSNVPHVKAVLLAAGQGTRLLPLTNDRPKCMVEYRGRPIIDHILDTLSVCSVEDIVLIKGYLADVLDRPCTKSIINTRFASTNMVHTLFCAEEELTDSCIISYTDIIYGPSILKALLDCPDDISLTVDKDWKKLWEARMEDPLRDAETLRLTDDGYIIELGKKPKSYDDIEGQYMGLIKLTAKGCEQVRCHYHSLDRDAEYDGKDFDNMYMTSFIQSMIDSGIPVKAVPISGGWLEIDSLEDLNHSL